MSNNQEDLIRSTLRELLERGHTFEDFKRFEFSEGELQSFLSGGSLGGRELLLARVVSQLTNKGVLDINAGANEEMPGHINPKDIYVSASDVLDVKDTFQGTILGPMDTADKAATDPSELPTPAGEGPVYTETTPGIIDLEISNIKTEPSKNRSTEEEITQMPDGASAATLPRDMWEFTNPLELERIAHRTDNESEEYYKQYGAELRTFRTDNGMTVEQFADKYRASIQNILQIESWSDLSPVDRSTISNEEFFDEQDETEQKQVDESGEFIDDQTDSSSPVGFRTRASKRASREELSLGADREASALCTFIHGAVREFSFALFGRWGRGKTHLMELVSESLEREHSYRTVLFNAWKYRSTPELWAHLYHSFVNKLSENVPGDSDNSFRKACSYLPDGAVKFTLAIRGSIYRHGTFAASSVVLASFLLFVPLFTLTKVYLGLIGIFGISYLSYAMHLVRASQSATASVLKKYGRLADHRAKLGAQALIGDDLQALLVAKIPRDAYGSVRAMAWSIVSVPLILTLMPLLLFAYLMIWPAPESQLSFIPGIEASSIFVSLCFWWAGFLVSMIAVCWLPRSCRKVLLVVDDLDRCNPHQMLEVIESIKLLLEDPEIQERVQVVMLIQEDHLRRAIAKKFPMTKGDSCHSTVDEHLDKLFIAHFRLGLLNSEEINEVADKCISSAQKYALSEMEDELHALPSNSPDRKSLVDQITSYKENLEKPIKTFGSLVASLAKENQPNGVEDDPKIGVKEIENKKLNKDRWSYSNEEKQALVAALESIPLNFDSPAARGIESHFERVCDVSPRYIRAFLYKYQLSRLLLYATGRAWDPKQLVDALMKARECKGSTEKAGKQEWGNVSNDIKNVVSQVI